MIDRLPHAMLCLLCCRHHQPLSDTEQYIEKISSLDERFELFMELKLFRKAADTANRLKDAAKYVVSIDRSMHEANVPSPHVAA